LTTPEETRWTEAWDAAQAQAGAASPPAEPWAAAPRERSSADDVFVDWLLPRLLPEDTVIDVGAGTGRHAAAIARRVRAVIAVEPSPPMAAALAARLHREGIDNVTHDSTPWPPEALPTASVVTSAHALYGIRQPAGFLRAMNGAATRECVLALRAKRTDTLVEALWHRLHGQPRARGPALAEALGVLRGLGIEPSFQISPEERTLRFGSLPEAVLRLRHRVRLDPSRDSELGAAIFDLLEREPAGGFVWHGPPQLVGIVSWQPRRL
jgi:SAM-dependent methyltransferase